MKKNVVNWGIISTAKIGWEHVIPHTSSTGSVSSGDTLNVGDVTYTFGRDVASDTVLFGVEGLSAEIGGFATVTGDVGFSFVGDEIVAVGSGVGVRVGTDSANVGLTSADFGLVSNQDGTSFELTNGVFGLNVANFAGATASSTRVSYSDETSRIDSGRVLNVGPLSYSFADEIVADTSLVTVEGFAAEVGGFVDLSGDLGFSFISGDLVAVGSNVGARLGTDSIYVGVSGANFGLRHDADGTNFELTGGVVESSLGGIGSFDAGSVTVQYSDLGTSVTAGERLTVGSLSYDFVEGLGSDAIAGFAIEGFGLTAANFVRLSGDVGIKQDGSKLIAVGSNVGASLGQQKVLVLSGKCQRDRITLILKR